MPEPGDELIGAHPEHGVVDGLPQIVFGTPGEAT